MGSVPTVYLSSLRLFEARVNFLQATRKTSTFLFLVPLQEPTGSFRRNLLARAEKSPYWVWTTLQKLQSHARIGYTITNIQGNCDLSPANRFPAPMPSQGLLVAQKLGVWQVPMHLNMHLSKPESNNLLSKVIRD